MSKRKVLLYRDVLLPPSNTFVADHARALQRWQVRMLGSRRDHQGDALLTGLEVACAPHRWGRYEHVLSGHAPWVEHAFDQAAPDVVHAHFGTDAMYILPYVRRRRIPLVVTFHGYDVYVLRRGVSRSHSERLLRYRRDELFDYAACFLPVSAALGQSLIDDLGAPAARTQVHYLGTSVPPEDPPASWAQRPIDVLFAARVVEWKGIFDVIRAVAELRRRQPHVRVVVAGGGEALAAAQRLAAQLQAGVEFAGPQSHADLVAWMRQAKVLCVPSHQGTLEEEAFGLVFIEAAAVGTPAVATWSGGIPEAVEHGVTGILVPSHRPDCLADAVHSLIDPDAEAQWSRFSRAAVQRTRRCFSIHERTALLEQRYDTLVGDAGLVAPRVRSGYDAV